MYKKYFFLHNLTDEEVRSQGVTMGQFTTSAGNTYSVWVMENYKGIDIIVLIHEADKEIAGILNAQTGNILYLHPRSIDGALRIWNISYFFQH
ncbi:MAG: hypothetical protein RO469_00170 [Thermincola sp.]|nr:hypothetical protein [Thermincola sp.]MDT3701856.1 hypothetical protein [Thermincola sp.]